MEIGSIVIMVFILLVVIYALVNLFSTTNNLTKMADGKIEQKIKAAELKDATNSSNYTYSMWINVDDWNYKFGSKKIILDRRSSPRVSLGKRPNTLKVEIKYYEPGAGPRGGGGRGGGSGGGSGPVPYEPNTSNAKKNKENKEACLACENKFSCACDKCDKALYDITRANPILYNERAMSVLGPEVAARRNQETYNGSTHTCEIDNIPIQKWVNVIISLYGRTLDIYLDGKLVRTCVLPGVPKIDYEADIVVTPRGGFSGWTSSFKFWAKASNPQEAYNIYKDGFGNSILANLLNKYKVRFSMMKGKTEVGSFEI